jgi:hypothetical protein
MKPSKPNIYEKIKNKNLSIMKNIVLLSVLLLNNGLVKVTLPYICVYPTKKLRKHLNQLVWTIKIEKSTKCVIHRKKCEIGSNVVLIIVHQFKKQYMKGGSLNFFWILHRILRKFFLF